MDRLPGRAALAQGDRDRGVFVIRPDGTGARRVCSKGGADLAWSPDGARLLVLPDTVVEVATGTVTDMVESGMEAAFTPDGHSILYREFDTGGVGDEGERVCITDLEGRTRRLLAHGRSFAVSPLLGAAR